MSFITEGGGHSSYAARATTVMGHSDKGGGLHLESQARKGAKPLLEQGQHRRVIEAEGALCTEIQGARTCTLRELSQALGQWKAVTEVGVGG